MSSARDSRSPYAPPEGRLADPAPVPRPGPRPLWRWLAAALSLVVPGAGQAYADRMGLAVLWLIADLGVTVLIRAAGEAVGPPLLFAIPLLALGAALDAFRIARTPWPHDTEVVHRVGRTLAFFMTSVVVAGTFRASLLLTV